MIGIVVVVLVVVVLVGRSIAGAKRSAAFVRSEGTVRPPRGDRTAAVSSAGEKAVRTRAAVDPAGQSYILFGRNNSRLVRDIGPGFMIRTVVSEQVLWDAIRAVASSTPVTRDVINKMGVRSWTRDGRDIVTMGSLSKDGGFSWVAWALASRPVAGGHHLQFEHARIVEDTIGGKSLSNSKELNRFLNDLGTAIAVHDRTVAVSLV